MKLIVITFFLGLLLGIFAAAQFQSNGEIASPFVGSAQEWLSPSDHIKEEQIHVYENRIVIDIDAEWARIENTNSMDPLLDEYANVLQFVPNCEGDIHPGDVISYKNYGNTIIHRVIAIEEDEIGKYYIVKGDNNPEPDNLRVRCDDIERVMFGILY